jgi:Glycosyltransferase WbsX
LRLSVTLLSLVILGACGGSGGSNAPANPVPTIAALSPNSSQQAGPAFTLSVVGSNFVSGSSVQWNGSAVPTIFADTTLLTASVPASDVVATGPDTVTVVNPGPGGGTSNAMSLAVPCVLVPPSAASAQSKARVGAYYFDGWSGPLSNYHFMGLPFGPYQDRQPLSGWQDNSTCAVEQQLAEAHGFGIDFFVFDWYYNAPVNDPGENLNSALQITRALADRHGMQYAIVYIDTPPFMFAQSDWSSVVKEWLSYMTEPDYVRVGGKPVLFVLADRPEEAGLLEQLRASAVADGLPGVYIVGGVGIPVSTIEPNSLAGGFSQARADGYDAVGLYNYPYSTTSVNGMLPFSALSDIGHRIWNEATLSGALPFIPTAMAGWDPRPWDETQPITKDLMWYERTPQDVATLLQDAIAWASANPQLRPEPAPAPPLVLIEAWNEFGEGSHFLPNSGDGTSYGDAVAAMLLLR